MPLDSDPPDLSASPVIAAAVADAVAAHATETPGHGPQVHIHCENCGTALAGPFCHVCGQHDIDFHRSFGHMFLDALENFFHFDAKLFRNIVTLLFRPGRLTASFNAGRRAAQMPPLRLYIFVSVLFFFISFVGSHPVDDLNLDNSESANRQAAVRQMLDQSLARITSETSDPAARVRAERAIQRLREANNRPGAKPLDLLKVEQAIADEIRNEEAGPSPAVPRVASETKPDQSILRPPNPDGINISVNPRNDTALNRFLTEKGLYAYAHQRELVEAFLHALPKMLLVCLPFFALYTRVLFRKSGQVYLHHLVLALHFHTFIFLWRLFADGWILLVHGLSAKLASLLTFGANLWLVLYVFLMLRHLFQNSWPRTIFKTFVLAGAYSFTLALGFVGTAIVIFLML